MGSKKISAPPPRDYKQEMLDAMAGQEAIQPRLLALEAQAIREGSSLKNSNYSARATKIIADVFTKTKKYRQDMILSKPYINTNKFGANMAFMKEQEFHTMREKAKAALIEIISEIQYKKLKDLTDES